MSGGCWLIASITKKCQNSRTDGRTPTNISQKWTKMATSVMELGERCCLSQGGPGGHCRYPEDRVPPHASSKSRRRVRWALMCAHVSRGSSSRLLAQGSSGTTTCPTAPAPTSRLRSTPELPCVLWLHLLPLGSGQLQGRHMSHDSRSRLSAQGSSGAATCPMGALQAGSH
jgi:hypothetical protein